MAKISIISLLVGVLGVANDVLASDQSDVFTPNDAPIAVKDNDVGARQVANPEVVLQLKYDKGELNKIYLTQFRKEESSRAPSVLARSNLCADLCHAGLGGEVCGSTCPEMIPVGLRTALEIHNKTEVTFGQPRFSVCPALCDNHLGEPLCNCTEDENEDHAVDWTAICSAFCVDGYNLGGCLNCEEPPTSNPTLLAHRVLNTSEGWHAWCNVQCRQGQGGAACNCDKSPFQ